MFLAYFINGQIVKLKGGGFVKRKFGTTFLTIALTGSLFTTTAFAMENNGQSNGNIELVSLGDSITFGYNLGIKNGEPSSYAFPYLIAENTNLEVRDLGVPGWTTKNLLKALKNDNNFRNSINQADYITLDIGNNDLLHVLKKNKDNLTEIPSVIDSMLPALSQNLNEIIKEVRSLSDAPIVIYNFYNPYQINNPLHYLSNELLTKSINPVIAKVARKNKNIKIADAFNAFDKNQAVYVRKGDIHPTIKGQEVLALIGKNELGLK